MPPFFQSYHPDVRLEDGFRLIRAAAATYRAARQPRIAERLERDLLALRNEIVRLGVADAVYADKLAAATLRARLVRPETPGPHLADYIRSYPLPGELGGVGFADIAVLDKAIDPKYPQHGTYWRAIEYGTRAHIGRVVVGYFQPGFAGPSGGEFRAHPYFTPEASSDAYPMRITRPIEPKHFLRSGIASALTNHVQKMGTLQAEAIASMRSATARSRGGGIAATRAGRS